AGYRSWPASRRESGCRCRIAGRWCNGFQSAAADTGCKVLPARASSCCGSGGRYRPSTCRCGRAAAAVGRIACSSSRNPPEEPTCPWANQTVEDFGVVENPASSRGEQNQADERQRRPRTGEAEPGDPPALGPSRLLATRPEHDGGNDKQPAEQNPVQRKPAQGRDIRRIAKHVRVGNVRSGSELNQVRGYVEWLPDKKIDDQESNISEIANVLVGRQG